MNETRGLWRGKHDDVDSSEWLVGYLIKMWEKICLQDPKCENNVAEVDPSTLGECTDLTDKNGNKIFEGDIVKAKWRYLSNTDTVIGVVKYDNADFILETDEHYLFFEDNIFSYECEVIGNIHDNPELLNEK